MKDEILVLTTNGNKKRIIENNSSSLTRIKYMTLAELRDKRFFSYDERALYQVMKRENVSYSIAKILLSHLYFLDGTSDKVKDLRRIYDYLEKDKLLLHTPLFSSFLKRQKVILSGIVLSNEDKKVLEGISYEIEKRKEINQKYPLYSLNNLEEEVYFLAREITKLIKSGIAPSQIKIVNLDDEYKMWIEKIFGWYHIPTSIKKEKSIYGTNVVKNFLMHANIEEGIDAIKEVFTQPDEVEIVDQLISIVNHYSELPQDEITRLMIIEEIKTTSLPFKKSKEMVSEGKLDTIYNEEDYIFVVGFNQGVLPHLHKDEDYLSDKEKIELGISTSDDKNKLEKEKLLYFLKHNKHIILSYKEKSLTDTYYPSSFLEELELERKEVEKNFLDSHFVNQYLLGKMLDNHYKYHVDDPFLGLLNENYKDLPYRTYSNQFKKIEVEKIRESLGQKLLLSYSSMDTYNRCSFRYYVDKVLKIDNFDTTFLIEIGNLYHYVLSKSFLDNFDFEKEWNSYIEENGLGKNKKEKFFLKKLKEELVFIIDEIKRQYQYSSFDKAYYEEKIYTHPTGEENITFMGIIDKLLYKSGDNYVSLVDYKTGTLHLNLETLPYGIEVQLPIYLYLVYHFSKIENPKIAGFYLQKILHSEITKQKNSTYEKEKRKNLYLQGYSTSNEVVLKEFDSSYEDSLVIKGLRKSSKGFYAYSKILTEQEMNRMVDMVDDKIKESIHDIWSGNFSINPKRIGFRDIGCEFCKYKDICYHTEKDVIHLKEYKNLDFLGGDDDAKMD